MSSRKKWSSVTLTPLTAKSGLRGYPLLLLLPLFVGASSLRCGPPGPCDPEEQGKTFNVTITKRTGLFSCSLPDPDPLIGQSFTIRIDGSTPSSTGCACGTGPILSSPDAVTWSNARPHSCAGNIYSAEVDVAVANCTTSASLFLSGNIAGSTEPNSKQAQLNYNEDACLCGGAFDVAIREVLPSP